MSVRFSIEAIFKGIDKFSAPVARMTTATDRFTRRIRKGMTGVGKAAKRMARGFRNTALTIGSLAVMGGFALKGLLGPAMRFQDAVMGINAVTRDRIRQEGKLNWIRQRALDLGDRTVFTTVQVANAMQELARGGLTTKGVYEAILPVLHAAGAENADIAQSAKVILGAVKGFGLEVNLKNTTKAADVLAAVASDALTNMMDLGEGSSKFMLSASQMDFDFPDAIAAVAALQDRAMPKEQAGTALKVMQARLATLSGGALAQFKKYEIDIWDKNSKSGFKSLPEIIEQIDKGLAKIKNKKNVMKLLSQAFGTRSMQAVMALIGTEDDPNKGFSKLRQTAREQYYGKGGAAEDIYKLRQEGATGALRELGAAWEAFKVKIASGQLKNLEKLFDSMSVMLRQPENIEKWAGHLNDAVKNMKAWWESNKEVVASIAGTGKGSLKVLFAGIWTALIVLDASLRLIIYPFQKLWELAKFLTPNAQWVKDFDAAIGSLHPGAPGPQTYGAPYKEGVYGEIIVKAEPGTSARVGEVAPNGVPIMLQRNGDFKEPYADWMVGQ